MSTRRLISALVVVGAYVLWRLSIPALGFDGYTVTWWEERSLSFMLPVMVVLALAFGGRAARVSLLGFFAGQGLGTVIGEPIYQAQRQRLAEQLADPTYMQNWEPSDPGCGLPPLCW